MGYYSDASLCIRKDAIARFSAKLAICNLDQLKYVGGLLESSDHMTDPVSGDELWHWKDVKWYDNEGISFMESLMSRLDPRDYLFLRTGEDSDDNEIRGSYWDNPFELCLERRICFERPSNGYC